MMELPSKLLEGAVNEIAKLPGIGRKSALRIALSLLKLPAERSANLANAVQAMRSGVRRCEQCHNLSDEPICNICLSARRDRSIICVVEDIRDVLAIEATAHYQGLYHVLGGVIAPIQGVGPNDLTIQQLIERLEVETEVKELILALSPTMEGDTTSYYIHKLLADSQIVISTIARGIPMGNGLEHTDEVTLARSLSARILMT